MRQSDREMAGILLQSGALTSRFLRWEMRRKISIEKKFRGDESLLSKGLSRLTSPIQLFLRAAWWLRTRIERRLC
ncbi:MAG: hypothetical protein PUI26_07710 [Selenomonadaceae bacterium]|nr:hypothetical protein [Selenomonadaceae bacterium]